MSDTSTSMLVPGSIWERKKKKGEPSYSRVIAVSNAGLTEEMLERYPQQVAFITDKLTVLTQPIEVFLATRTYYDMDEHIGALVAAMLKNEDDDEIGDDEEIDFENVEVQEQPAAVTETSLPVAKKLQVADMLLGGDDEESAIEQEDEPVSGPLCVLLVGNHPMADELQAACVGYSEAPFPSTGDTMHTLTFRLGMLRLSDIHDAFDLSAQGSVESFSVANTYEGMTTVAIDGYMNTFLSITDGVSYGTAYLTSAGDFRALPDDATEIVAVEASTVEPSAEPITMTLGAPYGMAETLTVVEQAPSAAQIQVQVG